MRRPKTFLLLVCLSVALQAPATNLEAAKYFSTDVGGCGYQECRQCPVLAPAIALSALALAAILVVGLQNTHGHAH